MANKRPDIYEHNNPDYAFVDSDFVRGGFRTSVDTLAKLYELDVKVNQLKEYATSVFVKSESKYYTLIDINNINNSTGWDSLFSDSELNTYFLHEQNTPSATWVCTHNLGKIPIVDIIDSANQTVVAEITHNSVNKTTIAFSGTLTGKAIFKT